MLRMLTICCRSARNSSESSHLRPSSIDDGGLSPNTMTSPSDMVGPSPVTSNGTETTEIEDEAADEVEEERNSPPRVAESVDSQATVCATSKQAWLHGADGGLQLKRLTTNIPDHFRSSLEDESISVIHAPEGYGNFVSGLRIPQAVVRTELRRQPEKVFLPCDLDLLIGLLRLHISKVNLIYPQSE